MFKVARNLALLHVLRCFRFTTEYFENEALVSEYGNAVRDVFRKLKNSNYEDPYKPAQEQFGGRGSYGNGASMRVAPVALFYMDDLEKMIEVSAGTYVYASISAPIRSDVRRACKDNCADKLHKRCDDVNRKLSELFR